MCTEIVSDYREQLGGVVVSVVGISSSLVSRWTDGRTAGLPSVQCVGQRTLSSVWSSEIWSVHGVCWQWREKKAISSVPVFSNLT